MMKNIMKIFLLFLFLSCVPREGMRSLEASSSTSNVSQSLQQTLLQNKWRNLTLEARQCFEPCSDKYYLVVSFSSQRMYQAVVDRTSGATLKLTTLTISEPDNDSFILTQTSVEVRYVIQGGQLEMCEQGGSCYTLQKYTPP